MRKPNWKEWARNPAVMTMVMLGLVVASLVIINRGGQPLTTSEAPAQAAAQQQAGTANVSAENAVPAQARAGNSSPFAGGEHISYTQLQQYLAHPKTIKSASLDPESGRVSLRVSDRPSPVAGTVAPDTVSDTASKLAASDVPVDLKEVGRNETPWKLTFAFKVFVLLLGIGLVVYFIIQRNKAMASGGAGANQYHSNIRKDAKVTQPRSERFSHVAGCDEAVVEIREFVDFLRFPDNFKHLGARMPSGALLYGPPGTGKTLLAKALAGEANCAFFAVSGSDFVEALVGRGAGRVRHLFAQVRAAAPAVVFIDEIDAVGKKRDGGGGGNDERDNTLNQLLVELDGFGSGDRVVVVAATNRKDMLDPALLRPGRLSRHIQVGLPDQAGRRRILEVHSTGKPLASDVNLDQLAEITAGSSGADLANMINEAALLAGRARRRQITQQDLSEGHLRAIAGPEKANRSMSEDERELVAYHEAGHVLTAELCAEHEKAQRTTIKPRGQAAGLALYGRRDHTIHSAQYLHEQMVCALGGRAAEWVKYRKVSTGAANDIQVVNDLARRTVQELGMSPRTGQLIASAQGQQLPVSDATREVIDAEVERMVALAYAEAIRLLEEHQDALDSLAAALLAEEDLNREEIVAALAAGGMLPSAGARTVKFAPKAEPVLHLPAPAPVAAPAPAPAAAPRPERSRRLAGALSRARRRLRPRMTPRPAIAAASRPDDQA